MGGSKSGDFFKLIAQMRYAAVIHFPGDFRDIQLAIGNQLFYALDFMGNDELPYGSALYFREEVGQVGEDVV